MLSYKTSQNAQPLYDYYVETDLDSFDDQPVDYSKKYSDQDSYEECRRAKSTLKSNELPSEVSQTLKQTSNDEVKVYCIEGTPLTISYASSLSDLREVGASCLVDKSDDKHPFPSVNDDGVSDLFNDDSKKDVELLDTNSEQLSQSKEKEDVKEGKNVSFRNSTDISKASSPLMFSRSSSIGSLTSFEQQSIVDDRSSVSVFSALTSGLISPSDLPDSPGELMSPTLTDKDSNSKIEKIDVTKVDCDNECESKELEEKDIHSSHALLNSVENAIELPETKVHDTLDLNKKSDDDNEVIALQLETSNDSLDEVFENLDNKKNTSFSLKNDEELSSKSDEESDDDDFLLQQCIELGMPSSSNKNKQNLKMDISKTVVALDENLIYGEKEEERPVVQNRKCDAPKDLPIEICSDTLQIESKLADPLKSDEDSDEDDELLQSCIQLGMPKNTPNKIVSNPEVFVKSVYSSHSEKVLENKTSAKSNVELDADEIILQQCIELGMPKQSPANVVSSLASKTVDRLPANVKINPSQEYPGKDKRKLCQPLHPNINSIIPSPYQQYRMPVSSKTHYNACVNHRPVNIKQPSPAKKTSKNVYRKQCAVKSGAGDCDEDEILLQRVIEMGMPKDFPERKNLHSGVMRRPEFGASQFLFHHDMRDNCPDGISDGEEDDDDILENCINAGMPSPKFTRNVPNRLPVLRTKHSGQRQPIICRPVIPGISSESNKKCNSVRLPLNQPYVPVHSNGIWISNTSFIDIDSMRVYQTEDTPVLSPTASVSDLSSLSINESFLNNSRNSDCSESDDDDDELLQQCIRSGMPEAKRAVA